MYLLERVTGCAVYCILLIIVWNGISVSRKSSIRRWLVFYAFALALLGFIYVPPETADLYRIIDYMHSWSALSPQGLLDLCSQSSTPVYIAYFWLVGRFGVDGLLPASSALIYHLLIFSCIWDYARRRDVGQKDVALALLFIMSFGSFLQVISGIRSYLAFAIIVRCIYRETVCGRPTIASLPGYLIAGLIHSAGLAFVVLRLVILIFQKETYKLQRLVSIVFVALAAVFAFRYGSSYLDSMFDHANSYFSHYVYSYAWEYLIHGILTIALVATFRKSKRWISDSAGERNLLLVAEIVTVVAVAAAPFEYSIFLRFTGAAANLAAPIVMSNLLSGEKGNDVSRYRSWLMAAAFFMLFLACTRGDLCGYKFMVL